MDRALLRTTAIGTGTARNGDDFAPETLFPPANDVFRPPIEPMMTAAARRGNRAGHTLRTPLNDSWRDSATPPCHPCPTIQDRNGQGGSNGPVGFGNPQRAARRG